MSSTITLYEVEELNKDKNFIIEDLEGFISAYVDHTRTITTGQYFKHSLVTSIKLPLEQDYFYTKIIKYNYCKILNSETTSGYSPYPVYYFIDSIEWLSKTTIKLNLTMDTINTFKPVTDYQLSKRTLVKREHKDRYKIINGNKIRKIDIINEGINPNLFKVSENNYLDEVGNWYLVYQNNEEIDPLNVQYTMNVNPVSCFLVPENEIPIEYVNSEGEVDLSMFTEGNQYRFATAYASSWVQGETTPNNKTYLYNNEYIECFVNGISFPLYMKEEPKVVPGFLPNTFERNCCGFNELVFWFNEFHELCCTFQKVLGDMDTPLTLEGNREVVITNVVSFRIPNQDFIYYKYRADTGPLTESDFFDLTKQTLNVGIPTTDTLSGIRSIDRTNQKLIKIIKLPYCPTDYSVEDGHYSFDNMWYFNNHKLVLRDLNSKFNCYYMSSNNKIFDVMKLTHTISATDDASIDYESKLYSSEFYQPQFIYDNFVFQFNLELVNIDLLNLNRLDLLVVNYVVTTTINSRFMFEFPQYVLKYSTEAYDNILIVNRNNEVTLYSSSYINYIRTGYNYDVKTKNLQDLESVAGIFLGLGTGIGQTALGIGGFSAKSIWGATNITRGVTGVGNSLLQNITNMIYRQYDFEKNIRQKKFEATSVSGSDDIDLLQAYSNNKAKTCIYQVTDVMKSYVYELFRFYGYACNEIKKPVTNTRIWYNFLQADVDFEMVDIKIEQDILEEIKSKYAQGVTFIHKYNNDWNISQTYENWERLFFN